MKIKKVGYIAVFSLLLILLLLWGILIFAFPSIKVGEAKDITVSEDAQSLKRGAYLAMHVAVCMDCHSTRDWSKYSGPPMAGTWGKGGEVFNRQMGFPGTFYARNITPSHLKSWSDGEILRAFTSGVNKHGDALFPVMPYDGYSKMDLQDAYAIVAYIRSLQPIDHEVPARKVDFPINILLHTMPVHTDFKPRPSKSDKVAYGGYMAMVAGCEACHTPFENGKLIEGDRFAGGRAFHMPTGMLYSANITPDKETGIGNWSESVFVQRFKSYSEPKALLKLSPGEMNTVMPWSMYSGMDLTDLQAIYAYLQSLKPIRLSPSMKAGF